MEKKKLLLVAVSVGVFLVVVISASILIFSPRARSETAFSSSRPIASGRSGTLPAEPAFPQPATVDATDMVKNTDSIRGIQTSPSANASQETNFYINGEGANGTYTVEKSDADTSAKVTINIPKPSAAAVPDIPESRPASARPAPAVKPVASAASAAPAKPAARPAAAAKPAAARPAQGKTRNDYWVQTGAFSTLVRAEGVKETLAGKGITSIVENREVEGKTWYRVRVGPYTSETEANYWLALVRSIDGFADSQVRQTVAAH
ncbi:MAG: SPOR domain-containing protein [Treponema sp.]|jgi:DedD protein|nr:SPOR domain-containing protein [Treponema sp.]